MKKTSIDLIYIQYSVYDMDFQYHLPYQSSKNMTPQAEFLELMSRVDLDVQKNNNIQY